MKLRTTIIITEEVRDLAHYQANTLEEAARNQDIWLHDGSIGIMDVLSSESATVEVNVKPVKE